MKPETITERLWNNSSFQAIASKIDNPEQLCPNDAEFLVTSDGLIVNVEGWFHPKGLLIGEVLYVPEEEKGDKEFFGLKYRKVTLYPGTYEPIPYYQRESYLSQIYPKKDENTIGQYFSRYKQIFHNTDFIAHLSSEKAFNVALKKLNKDDEMCRDIENLQQLIGVDSANVSLGLTGSLLLGNYKNYHDLDIVFHDSPEKNIQIAHRMRELVANEPNRRLFEGGKAWSIRFFNDFGKLMCTFFTYGDRKDAPLRDFSMIVKEDDISIKGEVINDTHTMYTPSVLTLGDVKLDNLNSRFGTTRNQLPLVVYHTASRGDAFIGDIIRAQGALVEITQGDSKFEALCVIERNKMVNLTPPWKNYYKNNFFNE